MSLTSEQSRDILGPEFKFSDEQIEYTCQLSRLIYTMSMVSKKAEQLFQRLDTSKYFCDLVHTVYKYALNDKTDRILNIALAVLERLSCDRK